MCKAASLQSLSSSFLSPFLSQVKNKPLLCRLVLHCAVLQALEGSPLQVNFFAAPKLSFISWAKSICSFDSHCSTIEHCVILSLRMVSP